MPGMRLSIDYWHTSVAAALRTPDGLVVPVAVDGAALWPAGVAVDDNATPHAGADGARLGRQDPQSYLPAPGQHLFDDHITVGHTQVDPADLVAATLRLVADEVRSLTSGATPEQVVICAPTGWVTRQRTRMCVAAARAGLGQPRLITTAEAIVTDQQHRGAQLGDGSIVLVCRADATVGELAVLRNNSGAWTTVAVIDLGELGHIAGVTLNAQAAAAAAQALDAAGITTEEVSAVYCHVPAATMPDLAAAFDTLTGLAVTPVHVADLAAAFGAARSTPPGATAAGSASTPRQRWATTLAALLAPAIAWPAAILLTYQVLTSSTVYAATSTNPKTLVTQWYAWALIPLLAMLGLTSTAVQAAQARAVQQPPTRTRRRDPALGSSLVFAAVIGVSVAILLGFIGAAKLDAPATTILGWTLPSALPTAVILALLGLVFIRTDQTTDLRRRLRFPIEALALTALSTVAIVAAYVNVPPTNPDLWWTMEHIGAFGIGWTVALLLTTNVWRRLTLGALLGVVAVSTISLDTAGPIAATLIVAITGWWLLRLAHAAKTTITTVINTRDTSQQNHEPT